MYQEFFHISMMHDIPYGKCNVCTIFGLPSLGSKLSRTWDLFFVNDFWSFFHLNKFKLNEIILRTKM